MLGKPPVSFQAEVYQAGVRYKRNLNFKVACTSKWLLHGFTLTKPSQKCLASVHKALEGPLPGQITRSVEVEHSGAAIKHGHMIDMMAHMKSKREVILLSLLNSNDLMYLGTKCSQTQSKERRSTCKRPAFFPTFQCLGPPHSSNFGHRPWLQKINNAHMNNLGKLSNKESRFNKLSQLLTGHLPRWSETI